MSYNPEELDALEAMLNSVGWDIYRNRILKEVFDNRYRQLRKCKKSESLYERTNGFLDGIEKAQNLLNETVAEFKVSNPVKD